MKSESESVLNVLRILGKKGADKRRESKDGIKVKRGSNKKKDSRKKVSFAFHCKKNICVCMNIPVKAISSYVCIGK